MTVFAIIDLHSHQTVAVLCSTLERYTNLFANCCFIAQPFRERSYVFKHTHAHPDTSIDGPGSEQPAISPSFYL